MKRIRPAPQGRAYRYVRRMAHLEIVLAERGKQNGEATATVVGEEQTAASVRPKARAAAKKKVARPAKKKMAGAKR
jgi:large subunit ribosomal protein L22